MGNVEDIRKVVQDFVATDLKALEVRLEALEKSMGIRFDHVDSEFASADKLNQERLSSLQKFIAAQYELLMPTMAAHHASMMSPWEMEKRFTRLEGERIKVA